MTFYEFIRLVIGLAGVRFLFENSFQLPEAQKKNMTLNGRIHGTTDFGIALTYSINTAISFLLFLSTNRLIKNHF